MKITGIICEYNPLHNGHEKQLAAAKEAGAVVCLMSGNYVQRGEPAILDKTVRARAAIRSGGDLVLELPVTYALRSAEGFAAGGVEILDRLGAVDRLCFGSESGDAESLMETAALLLREDFSPLLREKLQQGLSFPAARQRAAEALGAKRGILENPNDILGVEYCKALLRRGSTMEPHVLKREGSYHKGTAQSAPSASVLRGLEDWQGYMSPEALGIQSGAVRHSLSSGERGVLGILRSLQEESFAQLPFGSEGLWRKLMAACRREASIEEILAATKSKRYTHSRLKRMLLCAVLGIDETLLQARAPYVRVLGMNARGGMLLRRFRETGELLLLNEGAQPPEETAYTELERRSEALYGLFSAGEIEGPLPKRKVHFEDCP